MYASTSDVPTQGRHELRSDGHQIIIPSPESEDKKMKITILVQSNIELSPPSGLKFKIQYITEEGSVELKRNIPYKNFIPGGQYRYFRYYIYNLDMDVKLDL